MSSSKSCYSSSRTTFTTEAFTGCCILVSSFRGAFINYTRTDNINGFTHSRGESSAKMLECLQRFLSHQVAQIRCLAAKSLVAFLLPSAPRLADASFLASCGCLRIIFKGDLKSCPTVNNCKDANVISGQLLALIAWIRRAPTSFESAERAK